MLLEPVPVPGPVKEPMMMRRHGLHHGGGRVALLTASASQRAAHGSDALLSIQPPQLLI
jgi:hypothetical protein